MRLATRGGERYRGNVSDEPRAAGEGDEPVDQLGIPMSREPTLDDVRSDGVEHRRLAIGCTLLVIVLLAGFYGLRVFLFR